MRAASGTSQGAGIFPGRLFGSSFGPTVFQRAFADVRALSQRLSAADERVRVSGIRAAALLRVLPIQWQPLNQLSPAPSRVNQTLAGDQTLANASRRVQALDSLSEGRRVTTFVKPSIFPFANDLASNCVATCRGPAPVRL